MGLIAGLAVMSFLFLFLPPVFSTGTPPGPGGSIGDYLRYLIPTTSRGISIYAGAAALLGTALVVRRLRGTAAQRRAALDDMLLAALLQRQEAVRDQVGRPFPSPREYARHMTIKQEWITERVLLKGKPVGPDGKAMTGEHPVHLYLAGMHISSVIVTGNGDNLIVTQPLENQHHTAS
ncbi:hypothetical protein HYE82_19960 [Streptomyces sp. BR123]|uniref:hypothetical protein n=1 Tax=Streptomyces sp. BR123 TaxID=2749828 RepID=UPI0015C49678|nr:hypothetical protein [Streptomyces sp. BR123]NXY96619.1 hypothetical protein [Streptomyces sp. BR123]